VWVNTSTQSERVSSKTLSGARARWIHSISARHIILSAQSRRIGKATIGFNQGKGAGVVVVTSGKKKEMGRWGDEYFFCCTGNILI